MSPTSLRCLQQKLERTENSSTVPRSQLSWPPPRRGVTARIYHLLKIVLKMCTFWDSVSPALATRGSCLPRGLRRSGACHADPAVPQLRAWLQWGLGDLLYHKDSNEQLGHHGLTHRPGNNTAELPELTVPIHGPESVGTALLCARIFLLTAGQSSCKIVAGKKCHCISRNVDSC